MASSRILMLLSEKIAGRVLILMGSERPIGGSRGQLEGLRGQLEDLGASQRAWGQPGGLEGQSRGNLET